MIVAAMDELNSGKLHALRNHGRARGMLVTTTHDDRWHGTAGDRGYSDLCESRCAHTLVCDLQPLVDIEIRPPAGSITLVYVHNAAGRCCHANELLLQVLELRP